MTFTGTADGPRPAARARFGVTTDEALRPVAEALVVEMGGDPVWVAEDDRAALPLRRSPTARTTSSP